MVIFHGKLGKLILQNKLEKIFKGKTIFISGHTGFIGTWLSLWLSSLGAKVVGYALVPPTNPSMFEIIKLEKDVLHIMGDIRDSNHLSATLAKYQPEFVFHLAAQPLVHESYKDPVETFSTNVMGTVNVLESIRNVKSVRICVVFTSDKCYENKEIGYPFKETDPIGGNDPYSASKGATELVVNSYRNSFFNPKNVQEHKIGLATVRAGNVIGGGDWAKDRIVPDCIRALMSQQPIRVRNPSSIRPWQHVLEPVFGILCLAMNLAEKPRNYSQAWNFGPPLNNQFMVKDIVSYIIEQWGSGSWIDVSDVNHDMPEAKTLMLDSTKAKNLLGWQPVYSFKEAISRTVSWYHSYVEGLDVMKDFSLKQIQNYVEKAEQTHLN